MTLNPHLLLIGVGLIAGVIDAVAGGGGLMTVPAFAIVLGIGPHAIGTNKIAGFAAALVALIIYTRKGHMNWSKGGLFTFFIVAGSYAGSTLNPYLPVKIFQWMLLLTCPIILWVVWKKDLWVAQEAKHHTERKDPRNWLILSGFACGFYDGVWGPGGGTFMFLSLLFFAKLPLLTALTIAKLANTASAGISLINYQIQGYVHWTEGLYATAGITAGAYFGSLTATKRTTKIIRPALLIVTILLILKTLF